MKVKYILHNSYLEVVNRGVLTFKDHVEKAGQIKRILTLKNLDCLLVDCRKSVTILNPIEAASLLVNEDIYYPGMKSIAFLISKNQEDLVEIEAYIMTLEAKGFDVVKFYDPLVAREWIENHKQYNSAS